MCNIHWLATVKTIANKLVSAWCIMGTKFIIVVVVFIVADGVSDNVSVSGGGIGNVHTTLTSITTSFLRSTFSSSFNFTYIYFSNMFVIFCHITNISLQSLL